MTREEAIFCEKSYIGETNCIDCKYYGTETCKSRESHRMAIKALEQEPVIDKIRAEIIHETESIWNKAIVIGMKRAVDIIDRYKAESKKEK